MKDNQTFEEALQRLEEIVTNLESGDIPLDESVKVFEEGNKLVTFCLSKLDSAEKKVQKLVKQADNSFKTEQM